MRRILIVEDTTEFQLLIKKALLRPDLQTDLAADAKSAFELLAQNQYDLIILDLHLPDQDGFDLFIQLQKSIKNQKVPVIFVTGASDVENKVTAFSLGAEDYIVKPFHPLELRARVEAKLKKLESKNQMPDLMSYGNIHVDTSSHKAFITEMNKQDELDLTHLEYKLLVHFIKYSDQVFSREQLLSSVWGGTVHVSGRTVDVHICELRKKLGKQGRFIESVSGAGYRLNQAAKPRRKVAA